MDICFNVFKSLFFFKICFSISGTSELFATCSEEDIRLWHIDKPKELLRITVPNMTCNGVDFMTDGHSIISGGNQREICKQPTGSYYHREYSVFAS